MNDDLEQNKRLAAEFIDCLNRRDLPRMAALMHPDFIWNTAVAADDGPNELRPMQSRKLAGTHLPHAKPRLNRPESLNVLGAIFGGHYSESMQDLEGEAAAGPAVQGDENHIHIDISGMTAEADRVAMEAVSLLHNKTTGRTYNNFYHHLFRIRDGKVVLFKEYQDTLHLYDISVE